MGKDFSQREELVATRMAVTVVTLGLVANGDFWWERDRWVQVANRHKRPPTAAYKVDQG